MARCIVRFIVPAQNLLGQLTSVATACVREYSHSGDCVFVVPPGNPVQWKGFEE